MKYHIAHFEFDDISLKLTCNGEDVDIRHNEAKLLALLIQEKESVLSKEHILTTVWQGKMVSEQAVFQNISHLRSIFGTGAIKTYSKRGYQWQLAISSVKEAPVVQQKQSYNKNLNDNLSDNPSNKKNLAKLENMNLSSAGLNVFLKGSAAVLLFMLCILGFTQLQRPSAQGEITHRSLMDISYIALQEHNTGKEVLLDEFGYRQIKTITSREFEDSSELEYPKLQDNHPLILFGSIREHKERYYVDFTLKGPYNEWQGVKSGRNKQEVLTQLKTHLQIPGVLEFVLKPQSLNLRLAALSIRNNEYPNDMIILGKLIETYTEINNLDRAIVLSGKLLELAETQVNSQQKGQAYLYQSVILIQKGILELAASKLKLADEEFSQVNDLKRRAKVWDKHSWLDHLNDDYPAAKNNLLRSAELAVQVDDKKAELHALTYLSVLAKKHQQEQDKYTYLQRAENKMKQYELPLYHFAKIPFHHAIYTDDPNAKEPHLKQVLEYTHLTPDHWVAQSSRRQLVLYFLENNRLSQAKAIVDTATSDTPENNFIRTLLAKAQGNTPLFYQYASNTFEQAQMSGLKRMSLDVALLLCEEPETSSNLAIYSQFILDNASINWRNVNSERLAAIGLSDDNGVL